MPETEQNMQQEGMKPLLENTKAADHPIGARAEIFVIDPVLFGVHSDERIPHDVLQEGARVYLTEDEA